MTRLYRILTTAAFAFIVGGALASTGCSSNPPKQPDPQVEPGEPSQATEDLVKKTIAAATAGLPSSLSRSATLYDAGYFAWQQFLFLNNRAAQPGGGIPRGTRSPDTSPIKSGDLLIWQTFAHKAELRPNGPLVTPWDQLGTPTYDKAYQVTLSPGTLDARPDLWNNLDEDSEIGSCQLFGQYDQQPGALRDKSLVLFEAKVNRDEYEYIRMNYGADQHIGNDGKSEECDDTGSAATQGKLCRAQLRARTDIANGNYQNAAQCNCPPSDQAICLPCGDNTQDGAIEIKAAWRKLLPTEDASRYYTTNAIYYRREYVPDQNGDGGGQYQYKYYNDTFALIGLHIIRKLQGFPDFVFTSFEHIGEAGAGDKYVVIDGDGAETSPPTLATRQSLSPNTNRDQNHAIPDALAVLNAQFALQLGGSVLANYRLAGVQYQITDCKISGPPREEHSRYHR